MTWQIRALLEESERLKEEIEQLQKPSWIRQAAFQWPWLYSLLTGGLPAGIGFYINLLTSERPLSPWWVWVWVLLGCTLMLRLCVALAMWIDRRLD